ncbi:helix-turn-helix transcriptional regulator [Paludifilum halophilum]|uniref:HTH cro/C1-type domain-containing protein n=1 Tax=Paludifilum halophilum TaxID=1642702 RepID=A0A235B227_9BACL|nr:helix-turn-helix transcriptional regulator [Paludifilum halophilum]OYD06281.1 hypothetical protein CHM34_17100 [Paludifilum halophilum]
MYGPTLKKLRLLRGLTQKQVADKVGVTRNMITMLEKGVARPSPALERRLKETLDASEDVLEVLERFK